LLPEPEPPQWCAADIRAMQAMYEMLAAQQQNARANDLAAYQQALAQYQHQEWLYGARIGLFGSSW
jgi:hypothetical protein